MMDPCAHCEQMMQPYLDHVLTDEEKDQAEAHLAAHVLGRRAPGESLLARGPRGREVFCA